MPGSAIATVAADTEGGTGVTVHPAFDKMRLPDERTGHGEVFDAVFVQKCVHGLYGGKGRGCPFLFSVLCLNYYEIFLILRKIELIMKTTTVALGPHFEDFIQASILSGRYNNASEVVRSGLRLLEDQEYASRLAALRYAIDEGEASGDYEDFDPVANLAELNARRNG